MTYSPAADFPIGQSLVAGADALNLSADASISADLLVVITTGSSVVIVDGPVSVDGDS